MDSKKLNIESFKTEKLSTSQQKMIRGGDEIDPPTGDPVRTGTGGGNQG